MPRDVRIANGYPHSIRRLENGTLRDAVAKGFLSRFATRDIESGKDDFDGALDTTFWAVANSGGTSAANFAVDAPCGTITGDTGTTDNGSISLVSDFKFKGDQNCGMEIAIQTDIVADFNLEVGFASAVPGSNASVVSDVDTPAITADAAILTVDTDQTLTTLAFVTDGSTANQDVKATTISGAPGLTNGNFPVAATYMVVRIELSGNSAYCYINGKLVASHDDDPQGNIEGGTGLGIWVYCRTRSTTAVFPKIDYVEYWQERSW